MSIVSVKNQNLNNSLTNNKILMNLIKIDRLQNLAQVIIKVIEKSKLKQIIDKTFSIKAQRIISNKILD